MTAPLALLAFALVLSRLGPHLLLKAHWPSRAPALGILAWQALTASIFGSLVLTGLALAIPEIPSGEDVAGFFHACSVAVHNHYSTPGGAAIAILGGVLGLTLVARLILILGKSALLRRRDLARQQDLVSMVCRPLGEPHVVVVEHDSATVYCLPGRRSQIVVTRGALAALSPAELDQVLAHERAHIRARHHVALLVADALAACLWGRLGFGVACEQIAELAEMHADDAAQHDRRTDLARALVVLAGGSRPSGALAASGGSALLRVQRLVAPADPLSGNQRRFVVCLVLLALATPLLMAAAPGMSTLLLDYCPVDLPR